jgi:hypothetical protein
MTRFSWIAAIAAMTWIPSLALAQHPGFHPAGEPHTAGGPHRGGHDVFTNNPNLKVVRDGRRITLSHQVTGEQFGGPTTIYFSQGEHSPRNPSSVNGHIVNPAQKQPVAGGITVATVITSGSTPQRAVGNWLVKHEGYTELEGGRDGDGRPVVIVEAPKHGKTPSLAPGRAQTSSLAPAKRK